MASPRAAIVVICSAGARGSTVAGVRRHASARPTNLLLYARPSGALRARGSAAGMPLAAVAAAVPIGTPLDAERERFARPAARHARVVALRRRRAARIARLDRAAPAASADGPGSPAIRCSRPGASRASRISCARSAAPLRRQHLLSAAADADATRTRRSCRDCSARRSSWPASIRSLVANVLTLIAFPACGAGVLLRRAGA